MFHMRGAQARSSSTGECRHKGESGTQGHPEASEPVQSQSRLQGNLASQKHFIQ